MSNTLLELKRWLNGVIADDSQLIGVSGTKLVVYSNGDPATVLGEVEVGEAPVAVAADAAPAPAKAAPPKEPASTSAKK